jgi:Pyridoxamine 5'-phosphate oxidase
VTLDLPASAVSALQEGRQAHLAIETRDGPHVTPDLYAWSGGALWFAVAATTLKATVLAEHPDAAAVVRVPGRSVVLAGWARIVDPRSPRDLVGALADAATTTRALARYTSRNVPDLLAFARDASRGRLGWRPPVRVIVRFVPDRAVVVEGGDVAGGHGRWSGIRPGPVGDVPDGGEPAVVALPGPVALPCRWLADERVAVLPSGARALVDLSGRFPVGLVVDEYGAPGPAAKEGTLLRGHGRLRRDGRTLEVEPERVVTWDGVEIVSAPVPARA